MAITTDAATPSGGVFFNSSLTISHTCTGTNLVLIVQAVNYDATVGTVSGITYNGVALTKIAGVTFSSNFNNEGWYLIAPATGTHDVVITWSASQLLVAGGIVSYTGAHQSAVIGTPATASGNDTTPTVTVSSAAGELVIDGVFVNNDTSSTPGSGQTEEYDQNVGLPASFAVSREAGAASVVMDHTIGAHEWGSWAVALKPVATGGVDLSVNAIGEPVVGGSIF